ncbi:hypothetical protein [Lentibacillus salicampi]|uniref:Uncharacterized protein n=1 Tax=Lentibacillus salicampi TaxID=175306 RepID=A0A4Y9A7H4_9BACI|nr:hypothetical protein [Lentibacillus salicampi]TFJ91718.1 hypothetical protein E4U82_16115 [Lentibacillus salicampi]
MWERIVSSIVTGLIVGLVIWFFQLKKEKRDLKNDYERELSILKERLCYINYDQNTLSLDSIQQSIPQYIEELIGVLQNYPLDLIDKYVEHNRELATLLLEHKINI